MLLFEPRGSIAAALEAARDLVDEEEDTDHDEELFADEPPPPEVEPAEISRRKGRNPLMHVLEMLDPAVDAAAAPAGDVLMIADGDIAEPRGVL